MNKSKKEKPYFISFIEEAVLNPAYGDYIAGRIEVYDSTSEYDIEEIRFLTNKLEEFNEFCDKWDFKDVSKEELNEIREYTTNYFYNKIK